MDTVAKYRFGPFEADAASGKLFKEGVRVRLQDQPFRLLVVLLDHAGEPVTREDIQRRIWPENTFVDFDASLRVAVRKLRDALGDSADEPRFIETIPRRGYRFLQPVTRLRERTTPDPEERPDESAAVPGPLAAPQADDSSPSPHPAWRRYYVATSLMLLIAATLLALSRAGDRVPSAEAVVVADFANSTGDPVFDDALRQGLTVALGQSRVLSVLSEEHVQRTLGLMGKAGARLTPALALDVCKRTAADAVLDGSIASVGTQYVLGVHATDCRTGDVLHAEQVEAARKEEVLPALDRIASRLRTRLGESSAARARSELPLAEATTPSLEALKAYSTGWRVDASRGAAAAIPFFKRAVEIDPRFAMAHAVLGLMYSTSGEPTLGAESTARAYALRDRVSDNERFFITAYYYGRVTGNQEKAKQTCEAWAQAYPRDPLPHEMLTGFIDVGLGKLEIALDEARRGLDLNPDAEITHLLLGWVHLYLGQPDETERVLRRAADRQLDSPLLAVLRYDLAFYRDDAARMAAEAAAAHARAEADDWMSQREAFVLASGGRLRDAVTMAHRAAVIATEAGDLDRAALFATPPALWQAWLGDRAGAQRAAYSALAMATNREVEFGAALALAITGDAAASGRLADDLARRFADDTAVEFTYVPAIRAAMSLNRHDPVRAIEELEIARTYELAVPRSRIQAFFGALYPVYLRGEAYLAARRGGDAAIEFHKIIDHRGIVLSDPIGALARLGLARAYALAGDRVRARAAYSDFLARFGNADPDLALVRHARAEYTTLAR